MGFRNLLSSIILSTLAACSFALNNQEIVNLIHHSKQSVHHPINLKQQTNALNWSSLHGPRMGSSVHVIQVQNNPTILFAFHQYTTGLIYKSIDSGQHWQPLPTPIDKPLNDLVSVDENRLLLASGDKIYSSDDRGEHWQLAKDFNKYAYQFFVLNPNLILLEVNRNFSSCDLYRSLDGGKTWAPANLGLERDNDFWGMGGRDNVLLVGTDTLNISTNGGESWTHADIWKNHYIDYIAVNSKHDIFLGGSSLGLIKTDPQGKTWENMINGIDGKIHQVMVDKQDHIYVLAKGLYRSTDNGQSWQLLIDLPTLTDFKVLDNKKILISTHDGLMLSDDSQLHYEKLPTSFSMSEIDNVLALDEDHLFAIDGWMQGSLYRSQDAGKTWVLSRAGIMNAITSFNHQVVALELDEPYQNIMVSKDKGLTWQKTYRFHSGEACDSFASQQGGIILSCYTGQYFSRDLSAWKKINSAGHSSGYFDGQSIYSCDGLSLKVTKDEGKNWATLLGNLSPYPSYMTGYRDKVILVAIYATGIIKMTHDGAWELINNGVTHFAFSNILALSETNYVVATDTGIFYTQDGGKHWTPENNGLENLDVKSLSANQAILLAGTRGSGVFKAILK